MWLNNGEQHEDYGGICVDANVTKLSQYKSDIFKDVPTGIQSGPVLRQFIRDVQILCTYFKRHTFNSLSIK